MSPNLAPVEDVCQFLKMKLRKKNLTVLRSLICAIKVEWESLAEDSATTLIHSMNNRISQVIKSDSDFILG